MPSKRAARPLADPGLRSILSDLRKRIMSGRLPAGSRLPSVRELASSYGVTGTTIHRCLLELAAAGFITTHDRVGTRVAEHPPHRYQFGLVMPELPLADGTYADRHLQAKAEAARIINRETGPRVEIFHAVNGYTELPEHRHLLAALEDRRIAGLLLLNAGLTGDWLVPSRLGLPIVGVDVEPGRPMLGQLHLRLPMFLARSLAAVAARGCRRPAVLINHLSRVCVPDLIADAANAGLALPQHRIQCLPIETPEWAANIVAGLFAARAGETPDALILGDEGAIPAVEAALAEQRAAHVFQVHMTNFPLATPVPPNVLRLGWSAIEHLRRAIGFMDAWHSERRPIGNNMLELVEADSSRTGLPSE